MASKLTRRQRVALKTWNPANLQSLLNAYVNAGPGGKVANPGYKPPNGLAPNVGGFTPFAMPERPPPGTYDPALDAQERAGDRGYGDLVADTELGNERAQDDFLTRKSSFQRELERTLHDLGLTRTRQQADYGRAVGDLQQGYRNLGVRQTEQAAGSGMLRGGALQQATQKRTLNEAHDRVPLDQHIARALEDIATNEKRAREGYDVNLGAATLDLDRGTTDRRTALERGGRENTQFGTDIGEQRWFQATQAGYDPPEKPAWQKGEGKKSYRLVKTPRGTRRLLSSGYLLRR